MGIPLARTIPLRR
ncbi:unnamed protein product [Calypogeia fissa]